MRGDDKVLGKPKHESGIDMFFDGFLITLLIPLGLILLAIGHRKQQARINRLEQRVADLAQALDLMKAGSTETAVPVAPEAPVEPEIPMTAPLVEPAAPGPWTPLPAPVADEAGNQDRPIVMRPDRIGALIRWLRENWVYAVSGVSLALAGVFLVQYGIENGLLPPVARVLFGIIFGVALVVAGEVVRRRYGGASDTATAYLPAIFSGAGLVSVFAAVLSARQMYLLIGPETAFAGVLLTAATALVLGWMHGPVLAALGLLGATAAPFLVGGSGNADWLFAYFALVAGTGLGIDAARRWAWVSVLALALGFGGGALLWVGGGDRIGWMLLLAALVPLSAAIPILRVFPDHGGPTVLTAFLRKGQGGWPSFPVRLVAGTTLLSSVILCLLPGGLTGLLPFALLAGLCLLLLLWADRAPALHDLAMVPAIGFLARLVLEAVNRGPLIRDFSQQAIALRLPETSPSLTASALLVLATAMTLAFVTRGLRGSAHVLLISLAAALTAPVAVAELEFLWNPSAVVGVYPWALHVIALAVVMVLTALRFARADGDDLRRTAHATLSALSLIALALFLIATKDALTIALAVLVLVATGLDRRFRLPEMALFVQAGVLVLGWRLTVDPGVDWSLTGPLALVILSHVAVSAAYGAALYLLAGLDRPGARAFLETGLAATLALFADVMLFRWMDHILHLGEDDAHWATSLLALPWVIVMLVQLYRLKLGGPMRWLRITLAVICGVLGGLGLIGAVTVLNPLFWGRVSGPLVTDTLAVAYALPALLLLASAPRLRHLTGLVWCGLRWIGVALLSLYAVLEIRRFWRGDVLSVPGTTQPELYSYTVALLIVGAALLWQAIARRSSGLRRVAMAVIALTVAKVFLIDASGLTGLTRVFSFLALGLSLAGLAWLNRWAARPRSG
jgi:uncharacterized membrane protein